MVVSVKHPGNSSGESRLQVLSLAIVNEFKRENSSEIPIDGLCVAISTPEGNQLSSFTEVTKVCSFNDRMKTSVHHKEVIEAYRPDSEEYQELQRSHNYTLGLENQSCLIRSDFPTRLEKNLSRVEDAWPENEDGGGTVRVLECDTEHKLDAHVNKIFSTTPILRGYLSVLICHNNRRTAEVPLVEIILRALEQFFMKSQIAL